MQNVSEFLSFEWGRSTILVTNVTRRMRYIARTLALAWAGWWTYFGLACGLREGLNATEILLHSALPGLVFFVSVLIAWRWETIGAIVLVLEGLVVFVAYPLMTYGRFPHSTIIFVLLTMALPPLVAGLLLLASWWKSRTPGAPQNSA